MLEWTGDLSVGVGQIDSQHKELFARINGLLNAMHHGQGKAEVATLLQFLEGYVVTHFQTEEKLMRQAAYPAYAEHKAAHDAFIADLGAMKKQFEKDGPTATLAIQIQRRVCDWILTHIRQVDQRLGARLKMQV